jgi:hypothetical protein
MKPKSEETLVAEITALQKAAQFMDNYDAGIEMFLKGKDKSKLEKACKKLAVKLDKEALRIANKHNFDTLSVIQSK